MAFFSAFPVSELEEQFVKIDVPRTLYRKGLINTNAGIEDHAGE